VLPASHARYGSGPLPLGTERPSVDKLAELNDGIPPQPRHLAALFVGDSVAKQPGQAAVPSGISDALDVVQQLRAALAVDIRITTGSHQALHPGRTAQLWVGEQSVGFAGELLPALAKDLDLPRVVAVIEVDLDRLIELADREISPSAIASMPAATQDLSLVVGVEVPAAELLAVVREGAGSLLEHAALVDDYRGTGIAAGSKSLTFALRFRAPDRTLTAAEATASKNAAVEVAAARFGATLRE